MDDVIGSIHSLLIIHRLLIDEIESSEGMLRLIFVSRSFYSPPSFRSEFIVNSCFFSASQELFGELLIAICYDE
jgi:hypothetical protein